MRICIIMNKNCKGSVVMKRHEKINLMKKESGKFSDASQEMQNLIKEMYASVLPNEEDYSNEEFLIEDVTVGRSNYVRFSFLNTDKYIVCLTCDSMSSSSGIGRMPVEDFLSFLRINGLSEKYLRLFLLVYYGDGTLDGSGENKLKLSEVKKQYGKKIATLNKKIDKIKSPIINQILIRMPDDSLIDGMLFIGRENKMLFVSRRDIEIYMQKKDIDKTSVLNAGFMGIQSSSRLSKNKKERDTVQFKMHHVEETINAIKTFANKKTGSNACHSGCYEEYKQTVRLNKNRTIFNKQYVELLRNARSEGCVFNENNVFAITLKKFYLSSQTQKKRATKTDVILVEVFDDISELLLKNDYFLSDEFLMYNHIDFAFLKGTGISVKHGGGTTLERMTINTMQNYFPKEDLANGVLYYNHEHDLIRNRSIYAQCGLNPDDAPLTVYEAKERCQNAKKNINKTMQDNIKMKRSFVTGEDIFDDAIVAHYMMWDGEMKKIDVSSLSFRYNGNNTKDTKLYPVLQMSKSGFERMDSEKIA